jgi:SAM-dependent methyltransferase
MNRRPIRIIGVVAAIVGFAVCSAGLSPVWGSVPATSYGPRRPALQLPSRSPDIYYAPTAHPVADAMLKLAGVTAGDVVYDLGSGDGRIVIIAAQKYGARGVGIEIDPRLVKMAREVAREGAVEERVTFIEGDLFSADISAATVVTLFLSPTINRELEPKLRQELRPGTRIVSHQFGIGKWAPEATVRVNGEELFLWTVPAP